MVEMTAETLDTSFTEYLGPVSMQHTPTSTHLAPAPHRTMPSTFMTKRITTVYKREENHKTPSELLQGSLTEN